MLRLKEPLGVATYAVFLYLLITGVGKALDPAGFLEAIADWKTLPAFLKLPIAVGVPSLEIWLAILWLANLNRAKSTMAVIGLLVTFTAVYFLECAINIEPPSCACAGVWAQYIDVKSTGYSVLLRNVVFISILALYKCSD